MFQIDEVTQITIDSVRSPLPKRGEQGHVIVKPNLLIFELLAGYGYLFFGLCPHIVWISGSFKMVYIDGAYDSKAWGAINHFETTQ
jgi:hypothetical protein